MSSSKQVMQKIDTGLNPLPLIGSLLLFGIPALYFIAVTKYIIPVFRDSGIHPALSWFLGGLLVFIPLFSLALILAKSEGVRLGRNELAKRFRLMKPGKKDIQWVSVSLLLIFGLSGLIMYVSQLITTALGLPPMELAPEFTKFEPLSGSQLFLLLAWLAMFFFNIMGEELLWRGYILPRQELQHGPYAWCINSAFWMIFHACFGIDLMIILLPVIIILPYAVQRTGNTTNGILIHAIYNGPMFILVAIGVIK